MMHALAKHAVEKKGTRAQRLRAHAFAPLRPCALGICALLLSLLPTSVEAITVDTIVAIPPVSQHYVQRVLDRANAGIAQAGTMTTPGGPIYDMFKPWWIFYATSAMLSTVDTRLQITAMQRDLLEATPCLHLDVIILQSKIEKVRQEMHTALDNKEPFRVVLLQHVLRFLNQRVERLLKGGRDPLYEDDGWAKKQRFDPPNPAWCCPEGIPGNTCTFTDDKLCLDAGGTPFTTPRGCQEYGCTLPPSQNPLQGKLCPFHSNYLPPSIAGYGCDLQAMPSAASGHPPTAAEMSALADLITKRDEFVTQAQSFRPLLEEIDAMTGTTSDYSSLGSGLSRTHKEVYGCLENIPLAQQIGATSLLQTIHTGAAEKRGPFSIPKNEPWLMVRLAELTQHWGERRPQAKEIRYPPEFPPGPERNAATQREDKKHPILKARDWIVRTIFLSWNKYHGKKEAEPLAKSQDNILQIRESDPGMGRVTERFAALVRSHTSGLRSFGKGFAYYLRRSCIYRPCNARLDQVLRILFENSCFPYVSGSYFGNTQAHLRCKNDAAITVSP